MRRKQVWRIDKDGYVHQINPLKRGLTLCRRPSTSMQRSSAGHLATDCSACLDVIHGRFGADLPETKALWERYK